LKGRGFSRAARQRRAIPGFSFRGNPFSIELAQFSATRAGGTSLKQNPACAILRTSRGFGKTPWMHGSAAGCNQTTAQWPMPVFTLHLSMESSLTPMTQDKPSTCRYSVPVS
jgi:hypothetical protein